MTKKEKKNGWKNDPNTESHDLVVKIEDVFSIMGDGRLKYVSAFFHGIEVNVGTSNCRLFLRKGVDCVSCGAKGSYFRMERTVNAPPQVIYHDWHLNLYAIRTDGKIVLMTKDHVLPRSKGGSDDFDNLVPMCLICNNKKADKV